MGKTAGDPSATTTENSCTASEKTAAKNKLQSLLAANGINLVLTDTQINCSYQCRHEIGSQSIVSGSESKLEPWANPTNEDLSCSENAFAGLGGNIHSCKRIYYDNNPKANITFNSKDGAICGAYADDPQPSLAFGEGNDRWGGAPALSVGHHDRLPALHDRHT